MNAGGVGQPATTEEEGPECISCKSPLKQEGAEYEPESLPCGHTFDKRCLVDCVEAATKRKIECCPMRCHLSIRNIIMDVDDDGTDG